VLSAPWADFFVFDIAKGVQPLHEVTDGTRTKHDPSESGTSQSTSSSTVARDSATDIRAKHNADRASAFKMTNQPPRDNCFVT